MENKTMNMEPGGLSNFKILPNYKFSGLENADIKQNLEKWSMIDGFQAQAYSFDKPFRKYSEEEFLTDFLGCQNVVSTLLTATPDHGFSPIGIPIDCIKFNEVKCTYTNLEFFKKLQQDNKVIRQNGAIVKCMPHYIKADNEMYEAMEIEIADNLRKILLSNEDDSDDFHELDFLSADDKSEFLFSLFSHLVIGGSLCQYEDNIEQYMQTTKALYKDFIAVATTDTAHADGKMFARSGNSAGGGDMNNGPLKVISYVYKVHTVSNSFSERNNLLFNRQFLNNFFYVVVNPLKQLCFTLYHHF